MADKFWEQLTTFTNKNAYQYLEKLEIQTRLKEDPVTVSQLQQYIGMILLMGHIRFPSIKGNIEIYIDVLL